MLVLLVRRRRVVLPVLGQTPAQLLILAVLCFATEALKLLDGLLMVVVRALELGLKLRQAPESADSADDKLNEIVEGDGCRGTLWMGSSDCGGFGCLCRGCWRGGRGRTPGRTCRPFVAEYAAADEVPPVEVDCLPAHAEALGHHLGRPPFLEHSQYLITVDCWFSCHWRLDNDSYPLLYHARQKLSSSRGYARIRGTLPGKGACLDAGSDRLPYVEPRVSVCLLP